MSDIDDRNDNRVIIIDNTTDQVETRCSSVEEAEKYLIENVEPNSGEYSIYERRRIVEIKSKVQLIDVPEEE